LSEVKRMAELLKSGATMLKETCPQCGTPLFRVGKEILCAKCNRPVVIVSATDDETRLIAERVLDSVEQTLLARIQEANVALRIEKDPSRLVEHGNLLTSWLTALERVRKMKGSH
jgi:UPF0148 protein